MRCHPLNNRGSLQFGVSRVLGLPRFYSCVSIESWAAKEALYKALYPVKLSWKDISVLPGHGTQHLKPFLQVSDAALAGSKRLNFHLSITHDAGLVVAMVVVEDTL